MIYQDNYVEKNNPANRTEKPMVGDGDPWPWAFRFLV